MKQITLENGKLYKLNGNALGLYKLVANEKFDHQDLIEIKLNISFLNKKTITIPLGQFRSALDYQPNIIGFNMQIVSTDIYILFKSTKVKKVTLIYNEI